MSLDLILNSPLAVVILTLVCVGLILYGKTELLPKAEKLSQTEKELADIRREKDGLFTELQTVIIRVDGTMADLHGKVESLDVSGLGPDFQAKLVLLVDKIDKMEGIISKHPNNLEVVVADLSRSLQEINKELNDIVKGYETIASTLLQQSGRGDSLTGMERLR
mgnify:CR=1 FL=1